MTSSPRNFESPGPWSHTPPFRGNLTLDRETLYFKDGRYTTLYRVTKDAAVGLRDGCESGGGWPIEISNLKTSNLKTSNLKTSNLKTPNLKTSNLKIQSSGSALKTSLTLNLYIY
ncbi:hypothetical protein P167DRAFT_577304 [Morchella conica CCBAS932]|uniref:Uncharacterized protein n=1 Tax=Morchella conica CCBAS932 TaxID=1392247 RepID=A0A3N4KFZ1_9PEZI|nr:hypothetical protein P167DRAFT_577304 [Morchella conica CCBAS932]